MGKWEESDKPRTDLITQSYGSDGKFGRDASAGVGLRRWVKNKTEKSYRLRGQSRHKSSSHYVKFKAKEFFSLQDNHNVMLGRCVLAAGGRSSQDQAVWEVGKSSSALAEC